MLIRKSLSSAVAFLTVGACATGPRASAPTTATPAAASQPSSTPAGPLVSIRATPVSVRALLEPLAHDSLQGRRIWTPGIDKAASMIAAQMQRIGLEPAGDSGYFQRIPGVMRLRPRVVGRDTVWTPTVARLAGFADWDSIPADRRRLAINVLGVIRPPQRTPQADSVVLVDAHYDHVGIGVPGGGPRCSRFSAPTDSIFNGADDDASGTVAVLEIARVLKAGPPPRRTVLFAAMTGEESGLVGTGWYILHPVIPLGRIVANLEIEMIGRPDSLAGGPGRAWLTGYERSTMGDMLRDNGIPIGPDKRPDQRFFERSDNIAFARAGIPAHTLSSFNLHGDYHCPSDETSKVDFDHMASVINAAATAVRILADGPAPQWHPGGRPAGGRGGGPSSTRSAQGSSRNR
jgi:hypothetical protein